MYGFHALSAYQVQALRETGKTYVTKTGGFFAALKAEAKAKKAVTVSTHRT